jgi:DNA-directed RNA polymerase specialized sigma24 family protein
MQATPRPSPTDADNGPLFCELIEQLAADDDRGAFARLFDYFAPRVKAHLQRLGEPPDEAEVAAIEVMLAVRRQAHRFDRRETAAETFVFRIVRNRRLEGLRRPPSLRPAPTSRMVQEGETRAHISSNSRVSKNAIALTTLA